MLAVDQVAEAAARAAAGFEALGRSRRAELLDAAAAALEERRDKVVGVADEETRLGPTRLHGELTRTCYQFRLFAGVIREGGYLEATIDPPGETPAGALPDLRRMLVPVGPVAVFGASNFPLAFSVPGGDVASALAAGAPVVAKAHPSHPRTSRLCAEVLESVLPDGVFALVEGFEAGAALVQHPRIRAVGFTGSATGGRTLFDLAAARPDPIPFYGELGSLNPLVVTPGAATERAAEIAAGYVGSMTLGTGQFCTKPGLIFVPADARPLQDALAAEVAAVGAGPMLNEPIHRAYETEVARRRADDRLELLGQGQAPDPAGQRLGTAALFRAAAADLDDDLLQECFGPTALVVEYADVAEAAEVLARLGGQLTASIHAASGEDGVVQQLHDALRGVAGRLVFGGYPTGVAVGWATQHGGPYPAATHSGHTSVGAAAIRRWLRPVSYQGAPASVLPEELRDGNPAGIPRRVDGIAEPARR